MMYGDNVGHEYKTVLDGYSRELNRHPDDVYVFKQMLRAGTRQQLTDWYELYKDIPVVGRTRRIKKAITKVTDT